MVFFVVSTFRAFVIKDLFLFRFILGVAIVYNLYGLIIESDYLALDRTEKFV